MKTAKALILIGFAGLMFFATVDLPTRGDADSVMNQEVNDNGNPVAGNYYIQSAYKDAKTPNIVTVVLGDYRSIDTLGEQIVVFTAGLILVLILSGHRKERKVSNREENS